MTTKQHKFSRLEKVIGKDNLDILSKKSVLILGCGGVGGYVAEALARSNVGTLILVDFDDVDISNINRQIVALTSTIGKSKVDVLEDVVTIDATVNLKYGYHVKDVSVKVQEKVKVAVENMTGLTVADVNVRVAGIEVES